jgi:hypothetical protein
MRHIRQQSQLEVWIEAIKIKSFLNFPALYKGDGSIGEQQFLKPQIVFDKKPLNTSKPRILPFCLEKVIRAGGH